MDDSAKKKDVPLGMLKADGSSKRFYKAASVTELEQDDPRTGTQRKMWALTLDGRLVRTPANKLLTLPTKKMAMAIIRWSLEVPFHTVMVSRSVAVHNPR